MLTKFKQVQEQWGGTSDVIDHWLSTRQPLLVEYCKLAGLPPFDTATHQLPSPKELQHFCQQLVDYISEGHFKVYDMVMQKWESTGYSPTQEISQAYSLIVQTTDPALNFTDKYANVDEENLLTDLDSDLSSLGELIEVRFAFEDNLIQLIGDTLAHPPGA